MAKEISEEKIRRVIKCLIRVHNIVGSEETERFRNLLLGFRKQQVIDLIQVCMEEE